MKIVIISNGHGEDSIATNIADAILKQHNTANIEAYPLVGNGHAYSRLNIPVKLENPIFPSGGFIRSLSDAITDISAGLFKHIKHQRHVIKTATEDADIVIAVGDIFCLWQSRGNAAKTVFFPTAKSDTFMPHSSIETWLIRRHSTLCFPRDALTTNALKASNINAAYFGNPMMDNLLDTSDLGLDSSKPIIGILPGSREEAYDNLTFISQVLEHDSTTFNAIAALSPSLDTTQLSDIKNITFSTQFKAIINSADAIIGLAGTANEQAAFLGKPILCFPGFGPQSTAQRFQEQRKLMGNKIRFINTQDPKRILEKLHQILKEPKRPLPTENQNAASAIAEHILSLLNTAKG
jgi:hypothetical protein